MKLNDWSKRLVIIYAAIVVAFVICVFLDQRGYQDSWILKDVILQTIFYVFAFSVIVVFIDNNKLIALISASFLVVLNAIPNLKYELFYGTFDAVGHYGYISNLVSLGHVPTIGYYSSTYQDFPGMHIINGSISIALGISPNLAIKLFTTLIMGIFPLMTYLATNRIFEPSIQRFIIIASGLPFLMSYTITGTTFGVVLFFCTVYVILRSLLTENKRQYFVVSLIFAFSILFSHAATTLYLILFLTGTVFLLKFLGTIKKWILKGYQAARIQIRGVLLLLIVSFGARLVFGYGRVLNIFVQFGEGLLFGQYLGVLPQTLFRVPFSAQITFFALTYLDTGIIALMSCAGALVLFTSFKRKHQDLYETFYPFLLCFIGTILGILALQLLLNFKGIEFVRLINYALVLSPFLVGLLLSHLNQRVGRHRFGSALVAFVLFSSLFVSLFVIFPFQPIAPTANVMSPDLSASDYIFDFRSVNTVYQERVIFFAERYSNSNVTLASDVVTRYQLHGFTNDIFSSQFLYDSPLSVQNLSWDLFLLHYDGKAGPLNEEVENRTSKIITDLRSDLGNNVVYDNGESFVLAR